MPDQPLVFISHNSRDTKVSRDLYASLQKEGFKPWMAAADILPGDVWQRKIENALSQADTFIAIISKSANKSPSFEAEVMEALQAAANRGRPRVIPCILEGALLPSYLRHIQAVDLESPEGWGTLVRALRHGGTPHLGEAEPPESLIQACIDGTCVLYAGAGLSAPSGLPTWQPFVAGLVEWAEENSFIERNFAESLRISVRSGEVDAAADAIVASVHELGKDQALDEHLQSIFLNPKAPLLHADLLRRIPFSAVLTTNFDQLIEQSCSDEPASVFTPADAERLLECLTKREFFILKLYGTLTRPKTVLIAPAQYKATIVGNVAFAQFVESLFIARTILFLGASLEGIQAYLEDVKFRMSNRRHYALVAVAGQAWRTKADLLRRRYGIEVIPYQLEPNHAAVPSFLRSLANQIDAHFGPNSVRASGAGRSPERKPSRLRRLKLNGIGLFDNFAIELQSGWNIILGNNGVGKSTILRAIALALCGRDAQPYAGRMLKHGIPTGQIVLETTEGTEYIAEIARTSGEAEVTVRPARPLDAEGWLALGFPPLRVISWQRSKGPVLQEGRGRPEASDLLPIIANAPDPRLDQLKQWILTLDYRIKDERSRGGSGGRPEQLLNEFFRVIGRLTGGLRIEFGSVNLDTGEVLVSTDDGDIPIEGVSQGTASLLGWVGVLMQRLYMVYDAEDVQPTSQHVLVLIDEIDAHMHPEWQQTLVGLLSETFPEAQFIATTHSPLIVAGRPVEEIIRLDRDDNGKVVRLDVQPDMAMGRADQVLTGTLFGLETTLDPETQKQIGRYQELLGKPRRSRTEEEQAKLLELERMLSFRLTKPPGDGFHTLSEWLARACPALDAGVSAGAVAPDSRLSRERQLESQADTAEALDSHRLRSYIVLALPLGRTGEVPAQRACPRPAVFDIVDQINRGRPTDEAADALAPNIRPVNFLYMGSSLRFKK